MSKEDCLAEEHFLRTYVRKPDGRFETAIPPMEDPPPLGESLSQAVQRYHSVQRSLKKKGLWPEYQKAVQHFMEVGHAELVPTEDLKKPPDQSYYMPMHAVVKTASTTTRV